MPRFPKKEAEIEALAMSMVRGLWGSAVFPNPPVSPMNLMFLLKNYKEAKNTLIAARAAAEQAIAVKQDALQDLIDALKDDIRYEENTVGCDDDKLKLVGWAGKKTAVALAPPGQVRLLEAPKQGAGWVFLDWKAPVDGGKSAAYKVQRRLRNSGSWQDVATAILTEATLVEQPRGAELQYHIVAINKSGEGEPSNTAMVVL